jgi:hypothetical protein
LLQITLQVPEAQKLVPWQFTPNTT